MGYEITFHRAAYDSASKRIIHRQEKMVLIKYSSRDFIYEIVNGCFI